MATRCEYLTARCPYGCEVWLHPKAVAPHADRCRKIPWTESRRPVTEVLLSEDEAERARSVCPPELVSTPTFSDDRLLNPRPGMYLHPGATNGVVVRSPLDGITGRRWWTVAQPASGAGRTVAEALDPDAFLPLEWELELTDQFVRCDICGDDVKPSRLKAHPRDELSVPVHLQRRRGPNLLGPRLPRPLPPARRRRANDVDGAEQPRALAEPTPRRPLPPLDGSPHRIRCVGRLQLASQRAREEPFDSGPTRASHTPNRSDSG